MKDWSVKVYPAPEPIEVDPCGCVVAITDDGRKLVAQCVFNMAAGLPGVIMMLNGGLVGVAV